MCAVTRRPSTRMSVVLTAAAMSGCAPNPLTLSYHLRIHLIDAPPGLDARKIAVFDLVDDRDDMTAKAFGIEMQMVTAELPIATAANLEADGFISEYITAAFKDELKVIGVQV